MEGFRRNANLNPAFKLAQPLPLPAGQPLPVHEPAAKATSADRSKYWTLPPVRRDSGRNIMETTLLQAGQPANVTGPLPP